MNKLNILYIIWSLGLGGAEKVVIDLCKNIDKDKFHPTVCCLNDKGTFADELEDVGIEVIPLYKKPKFDPYIVYKIYKLIKKNKSISCILIYGLLISGEELLQNWQE